MNRAKGRIEKAAGVLTGDEDKKAEGHIRPDEGHRQGCERPLKDLLNSSREVGKDGPLRIRRRPSEGGPGSYN
jgi:hypothetical protein